MHRRNALLFLLIFITSIPAAYFIEICHLHILLFLFFLFFYGVYTLSILPLCIRAWKLRKTFQKQRYLFLLMGICGWLLAGWLIPNFPVPATLNIFSLAQLLLHDVLALYYGIVLLATLLRFLKARSKLSLQQNPPYAPLIVFGGALLLTGFEAIWLPLLYPSFREETNLEDSR
jgi:hypothetical protein